MKAEKQKATENISAQLSPESFYDINTVAVEAEVPCRGASNLTFIATDGIFTGVLKSKKKVRFLTTEIDVISFNLALNPAHRIKPGAIVPNCNNDAVQYLPAKSVNVLNVTDPQYIRNANNVVTNVILSLIPTNSTKPVTLGVRVKFEENVSSPTQFNPKRKSGTVSFP